MYSVSTHLKLFIPLFSSFYPSFSLRLFMCLLLAMAPSLSAHPPLSLSLSLSPSPPVSNMTVTSLWSSWSACCVASPRVWSTCRTRATFTGTWQLETSWSTATWCARCPTSAFPECWRTTRRLRTPRRYTRLLHHPKPPPPPQLKFLNI